MKRASKIINVGTKESLLYAKTDKGIQPNYVYQMSGNKISVFTLDLNTEFTVLSDQLNSIAACCFGIEKQ